MGTSPARVATNEPGSTRSPVCPAYCHVCRKILSCSSRATDGSTYQSQGIVLLPVVVAIREMLTGLDATCHSCPGEAGVRGSGGRERPAPAGTLARMPRSGIWRLDPAAHGGISFVRGETDWHTVGSEDDAFYLRIADTGGYRYPGADIGILVTRGRLQTDDHELTDRARIWINGIKRQFLTAPLEGAPGPPVRGPEPFSFKML